MGFLSRRGAGLPAVFWWLWAGALVSALGTFVFPFLALFLTARGFEPWEAGLVVAFYGAGTIPSGPIVGMLADRIGRRPTLLFSLVAAAVLTAPLGVLTSPVAISAAAVLLGIVTNACRPVMNTVIVDVVAPDERSHAFGLVYWANNAGMAASMVVGGVLAAHGYGRLFLADAVTTLLFAALAWWGIPETHPAPARDAGARATGVPGYGAVVGDRALLSFLGLYLVFLTVFFQFLVAAPLDMTRHGLGTEAFGRVLAVNGILIATLQPFSARFVGRFDSSRVLAVASILVGIGYGAYALCRTELQFGAATAVWTLGEIAGLPSAARIVADLSPEELRGRYQGAFSLCFGIALFAAPFVGSAALQWWGGRGLWTSCLVVALAVAAGQLAIAGSRRRQSARHAGTIGATTL
jgi:MFS family permease